MSRCCDLCGIPVDAEYFDDSRILGGNDLPKPGERVVLARFELHSQYCGVLSCFAQYTDLYAIDNSKIRTPGLVWRLLRNGQPLFPYNHMESILNPWGYGGFEFLIRLDENARVELEVENRSFVFDQDGSENDVAAIGGRILGRYWYNDAFGGRGRAD